MTISKIGSGITSPSKIIANVFISFIGAGLLGLPYAFKESGILEGVLVMTLVGYLSVTAMLMLIDCKYAILASGTRHGGQSVSMETKIPLINSDSSDEENSGVSCKGHSPTDLTYGDIGLYALGLPGKRLVDVTIVISQVGFCCGYLIYLCENLKKHLSGLTQGQWLILLLPPIYGLTLLRHLNKLAIFSLFAQVSNVFALAVVFWFDFSHSEEVSFPVTEFSLKGLPFFFAVAIYCYEGAGMILSLEESVAESKKPLFKPIFIVTMVTLTLLYISFGVSGYLSFGPHTHQIITLNLPHEKRFVDFAALVKISLGVSFFFTYPMMLFPVTHLIDKSFGFVNDRTKGNMVRLVLVLVTGLVVVAIPSFAVLASLIGATCCTLLAFIMPAAFHLIIFQKRLSRRQRYFDILLITLGVLGTVVGLWDTVHRIRNQSSSKGSNPHGVFKDKTKADVIKHFTTPSLIRALSNDSRNLSGLLANSHVSKPHSHSVFHNISNANGFTDQAKSEKHHDSIDQSRSKINNFINESKSHDFKDQTKLKSPDIPKLRTNNPLKTSKRDSFKKQTSPLLGLPPTFDIDNFTKNSKNVSYSNNPIPFIKSKNDGPNHYTNTDHS